MNVASAGTLDLAGFSQTGCQPCQCRPRQHGPGTAPGTVLTVAGNSGTIAFNTALGADNSPTDKLVVNGSTAGSTNVRVTNAGGLGAQTSGDGIELVQVNGASNGQFALTGRVAAGVFSYDLLKGGVGADAGNGNWYLRSGGLRPEVPVDAAVPAQASRLGLTMLGTARDRGGKGTGGLGPYCLDDTDPGSMPVRAKRLSDQCGTALWGRVFGETGTAGTGGQLDSHGPVYSFELGGTAGTTGMAVLNAKALGDPLPDHSGTARQAGAHPFN